jgi:hypothetical protein
MSAPAQISLEIWREQCELTSTPSSFAATIAYRLAGAQENAAMPQEDARWGRLPFSQIKLKIPSAIGLLQVFPVQTNNTFI